MEITLISELSKVSSLLSQNDWMSQAWLYEERWFILHECKHCGRVFTIYTRTFVNSNLFSLTPSLNPQKYTFYVPLQMEETLI